MKASFAHLVGLAAAAGVGVWVLLSFFFEWNEACFTLMNESMKPSAEASKSV